MDPVVLVGVVVALGCGGYAAFTADARFAGIGVVVLALLDLLAMR